MTIPLLRNLYNSLNGFQFVVYSRQEVRHYLEENVTYVNSLYCTIKLYVYVSF